MGLYTRLIAMTIDFEKNFKFDWFVLGVCNG